MKKRRPHKDTKPPGCEIVSSSTSRVGAYGLTWLAQNKNCKTNTNMMHEEMMGGKSDVFVSWTKYFHPGYVDFKWHFILLNLIFNLGLFDGLIFCS